MGLYLEHVVGDGISHFLLDIADKSDGIWVELYIALRFGHIGITLSTGLYGDANRDDSEYQSLVYFNPSCHTYDLDCCFSKYDTWTLRRAIRRKELDTNALSTCKPSE